MRSRNVVTQHRDRVLHRTDDLGGHGSRSDEKQGVASAVNDTSREMGALGIAVAGSILAGRYSHELAPRLAGFPAPVRGPATDSLAKAVEVAGRLGPQGGQLAEASKAAFLAAMHASTTVMAVIVAVAAVLIGLWAPGRDGRQLRLVRRALGGRRVAAPNPRTGHNLKRPRRLW